MHKTDHVYLEEIVESSGFVVGVLIASARLHEVRLSDRDRTALRGRLNDICQCLDRLSYASKAQIPKGLIDAAEAFRSVPYYEYDAVTDESIRSFVSDTVGPISEWAGRHLAEIGPRPNPIPPVSTHELGLPLEEIGSYCKTQPIALLWAFGSAARGELNEESDIDFLVKFLPDSTPSLSLICRIMDDLSAIVLRRVDLVTVEGLKPALRETVLSSSVVIYERR